MSSEESVSLDNHISSPWGQPACHSRHHLPEFTGGVLIVVAAGQGRRLGSDIPKAAVRLGPKTLLGHCLDSLNLPGSANRQDSLRGADPVGGAHAVAGISSAGEENQADQGTRPFALVVCVLPPEQSGQAGEPASSLGHVRRVLAADVQECAAGTSVPVMTVTGGETRNDSVMAGFRAAEEYLASSDVSGAEAYYIHDAARSFTPWASFEAVSAALAAGARAVVPAIAVTDTLKQVRPVTSPVTRGVEVVERTLDRAHLRAIQTPQGFSRATMTSMMDYLSRTTADDVSLFTDEAAVAEHLGITVHSVQGDERAMKITTPQDLRIAGQYLSPAISTQLPTTSSRSPEPPQQEHMRIGIGQDIHAFAPADQARELWLAGLHWPGEQGLSGHSDGDVAAHACADALFSAAGMGDLGSQFGADTLGTSEQVSSGISGAELLREAARRVRAEGYDIANIAVQIIGQRPIFSPRREEANQCLSNAAGTVVTVSATTSDRLGFTGRSEGLMATATALIYPHSVPEPAVPGNAMDSA